MRGVQILNRPYRHDPGRVHRVVAGIIMPLGVVEIAGVGNPRPLVKITHVSRQVGVVGDAPDIALEMTMIDEVEAQQGGQQAPVRLGRRVTGQEA